MHNTNISLETMMSKYSQSCIYALVHRSERRLQIFGSINMLVHLGKLLEEIKTSGEYTKLMEDLNEIDIVILETSVSSKDMKLKIGNYVSKYKNDGYVMYKEITTFRYYLETTIESRDRKIVYCLYVRNRNDITLVGIFNKKNLMEDFIRKSYPNNHIDNIVLHDSIVKLK